MSLHDRTPATNSAATLDELEALIRDEYERLHPGDTFEQFKRRSTFDKNDKGLMQSWLAIAAARHASRASAQTT